MLSSKALIAIAAGVGGVAPNLVYLAQGFVRQTPDVPGSLFYAGVAIFFGLGAMVAIIFAETDARKAFFLGISLPAFIAAAQTQGHAKAGTAVSSTQLDSPASPAPVHGFLLNLIPSAHAQSSGVTGVAIVPKATTAKDIAIQPLVGCGKCEVWFLNESGKILEKNSTWGNGSISTFAVPKGATKFGIVDGAVNFEQYEIPTSGTATPTFEFSHKYNAWKDFRRGLGDYDIRSYDAVVRPK